MCLHYGQEVFEGMKAYKTADGRALLFRPEKNMARLNRSNERLCIPLVDEAFCVEALKKLVSIEKDWIPTAEGHFFISASVYFRRGSPGGRASGKAPDVPDYLLSGGRLLS